MSDAEYVPQAWRMTDYYPDSYAKFMSALGIGIDYDDADFDRYHAEFLADLAEHDRQVAERAWGEGALWAAVECGAIDDERQAWLTPGDNPYTKGEQK